MRMPEGVEWVVHVCVNLALADGGDPVTAARLADFYELPAPYLTKHLQALAHHGIVVSQPGPRGGFRLSRPPAEISILDLVEAVEGRDPFFECREIRRCGPAAADPANASARCTVASIFDDAERAWRGRLAEHTIEQLATDLRGRAPSLATRTIVELRSEATG